MCLGNSNDSDETLEGERQLDLKGGGPCQAESHIYSQTRRSM